MFTGSEAEALDSYYNLAAALQPLGISSCFTEDANQDLSQSKALVVYLTEHCLQQPHVLSLFKSAKVRFPIHDVDFRRAHSAVNGKSEFDAAMLKQGAPKEAWEIINSSSIDRPSNSRKPGQEQNRVLDAILLRAKMQESVKSLLLSRQRAPFKIAMEKCSEFLPGTREWLFTDIARWVSLEGEGGSGAFVLLAGAGVGKSVIMAEVARRGSKVLASLMGGEYTQSGIPPVAMHFFRSSDSVECSIFTACFSIAQQLKALVPSFELPPEEEVRSLSAGQVFRHMIVNPCIKVGLAQTSKVVVLLDALDECKESKELVSSMQASWPSRPSWLLLVTASRPEDAIAKATAGFKPTVLVPTSQNNRDDLHVYLEKNLILWGCSYRYLMDVTEAIFVLSEGVFIWIKFVERSIRDLGATAEGITPKTILLIPSGMSNVYSRYFGTLFKGLGAKMYSNAVAIALLTTRELIPEQVWREALGFGDSESEMDRFTELVLEPASKLLLFETTESGERVLKPPHKSMLDWLTVGASSMSLEALAVTATAHHHEMVARVLERHYRAQSGEAWEVFSGSDLVREFATAHVGYHFAQADNWTEASKPFVEFDYLFRTVCQARKDERYERMLDDCAGLLTSPIPPATAKRVKFILSVLTLARTSLMHDPRELAGQTLGRVMVAPFDEEDQQFWICAAQDWIARASAKGGLKVAVPLVFGRSGLEPADTKLLKILNHSSGVTSIAFSRDRQTVVVGCKNNTVRVWDVNTSKSLQVFEAHAKGVNSVCFSQDGKTVVSGSGDCTTRVWDVATGAELQCFTGDTASGDLSKDAGVYAVALSPDGSAVLMGSFDSTAIVWDVKTGKELRRFKGDHEGAVFTVAISSDGKLAATGSDDGTASVWDMATGKELQCFKGHTSAVYSVVFSSDAKTIVTGAADGDARVWDVSTGASVHTLKGHSDAIYSVAISQNAKTIITGSADATIKVWDADTGAEVECLEGHTGYLYGVSLSEDGQMLATCGDDMTARIWNLKVGKALKALKSLGSPTSMVLAPDGRTILTGSTDRIVRAWDVESGELVQSFAGHTGTVLSIKVSLDSKRIQTKDNKSNILVWDLKSGARLDDVTIVCSSTDSVDCSSDGCVVPACSDEEVADSSVVGFTLDMPNTDLEGLGSITYGEFGSSFLAWTIGDSKCRG